MTHRLDVTDRKTDRSKANESIWYDFIFRCFV